MKFFHIISDYYAMENNHLKLISYPHGATVFQIYPRGGGCPEFLRSVKPAGRVTTLPRSSALHRDDTRGNMREHERYFLQPFDR
jgi:hypothetical protein